MSCDIIYNKEGRAVRSSKSLRGLLEHARNHLIKKITLDMDRRLRTGTMHVLFANGDWTVTHWVDHTCMVDWLAKRRSWAGTVVHVKWDNITYTLGRKA